MKRKTFFEGRQVEFKRDTEHGRQWEPGTYYSACHDEGEATGWHYVDSIDGERFYVPSRRVRERQRGEPVRQPQNRRVKTRERGTPARGGGQPPRDQGPATTDAGGAREIETAREEGRQAGIAEERARWEALRKEWGRRLRERELRAAAACTWTGHAAESAFGEALHIIGCRPRA